MLTHGLAALFMMAGAAWASSTASENFTSTAQLDAAKTTLVWNISSHTLHPTLILTNAQNPALTVLPDIDIAVGTGRDGAFDSTTYAKFSSGGDVSGNKIRLDTDVYQSLEVTSFHLEAGWTLEPVGSHPLVIRSLSDVLVDGTIECSGVDGDPANGDLTITPQGGKGRCGGKDGGNGGSQSAAATAGADSGATVTGGKPGTAFDNAGGGDGGGGGGGYGSVFGMPTAGAKPSGAGNSAAGAATDEPTFAEMEGGSGGGGGAAYPNVGAAQSSGGGGGGGGGVVEIYAVGAFKVSGTIRAVGGNGGAAGGVLLAGGGGGGGAGSILIWVNGEIDYNSANPAVAKDPNLGNAWGSLGGTSTGGDGGKGGSGRTWIINSVSNPGGGAAFNANGNSEIPVTNIGDPGWVQYKLASQVATSKTYDLGNTNPSLTSIETPTVGSGGLTVEVAGSSDAFAADDSGWVDISGNIDALQGKRYLKFRITITNTDGVNPTTTSGVIFTYDGGQKNRFDFVPACGHVRGSGGFDAFPLLILGVLFFSYSRSRRLRTI